MLIRFLRLALGALFRVRVLGDYAAHGHARTLIVANHESFLDGLLLGLFLPVEPVFVVHTQIAAHPFFGRLLKFVEHLEVDAANPMAMKAIVKLVESGRPVVIFPEGRITVTGSLMKVYDGAAFVAAKTAATVVPVRIEGAARSYFGRLGGLYPLQLLPRITLHILPPRTMPMPDRPSARERRAVAGQHMRALLTEMLVVTRPRLTLFEAFLSARASFGRNHKVVEDVRLIEESYGSLTKMSLALGRLVAQRSERGEYVGLLLPNAAATLAAVLGTGACARVPAMLNYTAGVDGLRAACTAARIRSVFTSHAFLEKGHLEHLPQALTELNWYYLEDLRAQFGRADKLWLLPRLLLPRLLRERSARPEDPAVVLFTSGSEGRPKGVVHTHDSLLANIAQVRAIADFTPLDKFMVALPMFHSFGLTAGALLPLMAGCKAFLYPSPLHYRVIPELSYDRNCTVLFGTSTFLGNYAKFAHPYDFGRLRYVVAGAEKLDESVRRAWIERFGIRILEGYGVTECAPVLACNVPMACRSGSVGQLVPAMQSRLVPVEGLDDGSGVLEVRGPNVMLGYLRYEAPGVIEPPRASGEDGWYSTGDICSVDEDGFIHIRGRLKRFAKIAGEMVSLEVVENLARSVAPQAMHAAATRSDAGKGEAIVLFTTERGLEREALLTAARRLGVPELAVPRDIRPLAEIPLLGTGKTDYAQLQSLATG
ncbi:bifunctional acyl-ACP--phospholipid O-acyltransferase/long-chain-fatty-acid--ACP ligase [Plasticicumulans acidivorans]|uniref:Acyl-[acyl-carrier-protein]-phospholipid O-acyltransferase/long-chain-fatty-acid--[acyl-carrier-protein] ligase n=1 Tax=Plasticicumulans acidivorans TaxID=886464 RepID=A0A317MT07_9GAMM|nr:bifunctional acyl-ACP--phospholipid O-acyltransferase/long-chain-fatty-acid--ACP ligase [Plasticicumulans acidivorans]PWV60547.1 acyl-[acyl-carrier-protein]-phospholipid O-acyltransferase/long-chain-fatty-acid--[acyl-carrier-protein] ligase [Plasticicumulans acidivorans]